MPTPLAQSLRCLCALHTCWAVAVTARTARAARRTCGSVVALILRLAERRLANESRMRVDRTGVVERRAFASHLYKVFASLCGEKDG